MTFLFSFLHVICSWFWILFEWLPLNSCNGMFYIYSSFFFSKVHLSSIPFCEFTHLLPLFMFLCHKLSLLMQWAHFWIGISNWYFCECFYLFYLLCFVEECSVLSCVGVVIYCFCLYVTKLTHSYVFYLSFSFW